MFFRALRLELQIHRTRLLVLVIGVALIFIASDFSYYSQLYLQNFPESRVTPSFWDQLAHSFEGTYPFIPDRANTFQIPIVYLMQHLLLLISLGGTTESCLGAYGYELFTRLPKRRIWWYAHSAFCLFVSILYSFTAFMITAGFSFIVQAGLSPSDYMVLALPAIEPWPGQEGIQIFTLLLTPFFVWAAMGLLQQVIELLTNAWFAFFVLLSLVIAGAFSDSPLLFTSHTMLLRSYSFEGSGTTFQQTVTVCLCVIFVSLVVGLTVLPKKDLLVRG